MILNMILNINVIIVILNINVIKYLIYNT